MLVCWRVSCLSASQIAVAFEINFQVLTYLGPPKHIQRIHWIASKTHRQPSNSGKWRSINLIGIPYWKVVRFLVVWLSENIRILGSRIHHRVPAGMEALHRKWDYDVYCWGQDTVFFLGTLRIQAPPDRTGFFGLQSYPWKSIFRCNPFEKDIPGFLGVDGLVMVSLVLS